MKRRFIAVVCLLLSICMILPLASACKKNPDGPGNDDPNNSAKTKYSNEETPLVIASEALDGVFNPFYYTSGADGSVVGMTQLGMLTTDKDGNLACGKNEDCIALNYSVVPFGSLEAYNASNSYNDYYTDYYFAIKNGVKFSNGHPVTINDVLFNLYVLLDPVYTGSSTLYSVNIQGLKAYRAQTEDLGEQDAMNDTFVAMARDKIDQVVQWCDDDASVREDQNETVKQVIAKAEELFRQELNSDWASADSQVESYREKYGKKADGTYYFDSQWQVFLAMEGLITIKAEKENGVTTYEIDYNGYDAATIDHSQASMVNTVYNANLGVSALDAYKSKLKQIVAGGWMTAGNLMEYFKSVAISEYFSSVDMKIPNVSGITTSRGTAIPGTNGDIALGEECDILKIRINGVDPKAIYNFSFTVAPMSYYSTPEEIAAFSIENNRFGVKFSNQAFFDQLQTKQVPVGAGPYKASNAATSCAADDAIPTKNEFFNNNVVYFERNNHFYTVLGNDTAKNAKIRKLRYKVISTDQMFNAVTGATKEVYYSEPQATSTNINKLTALSGVSYALANNMGYGYIGVNADKVEDINIRRAIMYCMDTSLCLSYYGGSTFASILHRSMSSNSWAYPEGCEPYYGEFSYVDGKFNDALAKESARQAAADAGYTMNAATGKLTNTLGETLTYTFTIAGDSNDHPAYQTMQKAATLLNDIGFEITVTKDASALSKLASGGLQVWAAAWGSGIDPDMYQVYHKDSTATSIKNWGFPHIMEEGTTYENDLLDALAILIEDARATVDQEERKALYAQALDLVMELAVELATYQRKNLFIWNNEVINSSTLAEATAYQSPLSNIWEVSLNEG